MTFWPAARAALWLAVSAPAPAAQEDGPPIAYRCDQLRMERTPEGGVCSGHVVLRRGPWRLCCERLTGTTDGRGGWRSFVCEGDVRGAHGGLSVWARRAHFDAKTERLTLTGEPVALRDGSRLAGRRMVVHTTDDVLEVISPVGQLDAGPSQGALGQSPADDSQSLPDSCPLPPRPPANGAPPP